MDEKTLRKLLEVAKHARARMHGRPRLGEGHPGKPSAAKAFLNTRQRAMLILVIALIIGLLMFPPFVAKLPSGATENLGHGFIFHPPIHQLAYPNRGDLTGSVDIGVLITEWLGVLIAGAVSFLLFKE